MPRHITNVMPSGRISHVCRTETILGPDLGEYSMRQALPLI